MRSGGGFAPLHPRFPPPTAFVNLLLLVITTKGRGGMAYAALDHSFSGMPIPTHVPSDFPNGKLPPRWLPLLDRRDAGAAPRLRALHGVETAAYEFCGEAEQTASRVAEHLRTVSGAGVHAPAVYAMLRRACELGVMIEGGGHFLGLALPVYRNW